MCGCLLTRGVWGILRINIPGKVKDLANDIFDRVHTFIGPGSVFLQVVSFAADMEPYITKISDVHYQIQSSLLLFTGDITELPNTLFKHAKSLMPTITTAIEGMKGVTEAREKLQNSLLSVSTFIRGAADFAQDVEGLVETHVTKYVKFLDPVREQIAQVRTVIETIETMLGSSGLGAGAMQATLVAYMRSLIVDVKATLLQEGMDIMRLLREAFEAQLGAGFASFNLAAAGASGVADAVAAVRETSSLVNEVTYLGANMTAFFRSNVSSPLELALTEVSDAIDAHFNELLSDIPHATAKFVETQLLDSSALQTALASVTAASDAKLADLRDTVLPTVLAQAMERLGDELGRTSASVSERVSLLVEELPTVLSAASPHLARLTKPPTAVAPPSHTPTSVWTDARASTFATLLRELQPVRNATLAALISKVHEETSHIPTLDGPLGEDIVQAVFNIQRMVVTVDGGPLAHTADVVGVPGAVGLWADVVPVIQRLGSPVELEAFQGTIDAIGDLLAVDAGATGIREISAALSMAAAAIRADIVGRPAVSPTLASAFAVMTSLVSAVEVVRIHVLELGVDGTWAQLVQDATIRQDLLQAAAFLSSYELEELLYAEDPEVDQYIAAGGMRAVREMMSPVAVARLGHTISAVLVLSSPLVDVAHALRDNGILGADSPHVVADLVTKTEAPSVDELLEWMDVAVTKVSPPLLTGIATAAPSISQVLYTTFALGQLATLARNADTCARGLPMYASLSGSGLQYVSLHFAAFRELATAARDIVTYMEHSAPSDDLALRLVRAAHRVTALHPLPIDVLTASPLCSPTLDATALLVPESLRTATAEVDALMAPLARLDLLPGSTRLAVDFVLAEGSVSESLQAIDRFGRGVLAPAREGGLLTTGWLGRATAAVVEASEGLVASAAAVAARLDNRTTEETYTSPIHPNITAAVQCMSVMAQAVADDVAATATSGGRFLEFEELTDASLNRTMQHVTANAQRLRQCVAGAVLSDVLVDGEAKRPELCRMVVVNTTEQQERCVMRPVVRLTPCNTTGMNASEANATCPTHEEVCSLQMVLVQAPEQRCVPYLQLSAALSWAGAAGADQDATQVARLLEGLRGSTAAAVRVSLLEPIAAALTVRNELSTFEPVLAELVANSDTTVLARGLNSLLRPAAVSALQLGMGGLLDGLSRVHPGSLARLSAASAAVLSEATTIANSVPTNMAVSNATDALTASMPAFVAAIDAVVGSVGGDGVDIAQTLRDDGDAQVVDLVATGSVAMLAVQSYVGVLSKEGVLPSTAAVHLVYRLMRTLRLPASAGADELLRMWQPLADALLVYECVDTSFGMVLSVMGDESPVRVEAPAVAANTFMLDDFIPALQCIASVAEVDTESSQGAARAASLALRSYIGFETLSPGVVSLSLLSLQVSTAVTSVAPAIGTELSQQLHHLSAGELATVKASMQAVHDSLISLVHDESRRLPVCLCDGETESPVVALVAAAVQSSASALPALENTVVAADAGQTANDGDARRAMSGIAASLRSLHSISVLANSTPAGAAVSVRDHTLLATLGRTARALAQGVMDSLVALPLHPVTQNPLVMLATHVDTAKTVAGATSSVADVEGAAGDVSTLTAAREQLRKLVSLPTGLLAPLGAVAVASDAAVALGWDGVAPAASLPTNVAHLVHVVEALVSMQADVSVTEPLRITEFGASSVAALAAAVENALDSDAVELVSHEDAGLGRELARQLPALYDLCNLHAANVALARTFVASRVGLDVASLDADAQALAVTTEDALELWAGTPSASQLTGVVSGVAALSTAIQAAQMLHQSLLDTQLQDGARHGIEASACAAQRATQCKDTMNQQLAGLAPLVIPSQDMPMCGSFGANAATCEQSTTCMVAFQSGNLTTDCCGAITLLGLRHAKCPASDPAAVTPCMSKVAAPPAQCCDELHAADITTDVWWCGPPRTCAQAAAASGVSPRPSCCAELRAANIDDPACPVLESCDVIAANSSRVLPARCCFEDQYRGRDGPSECLQLVDSFYSNQHGCSVSCVHATLRRLTTRGAANATRTVHEAMAGLAAAFSAAQSQAVIDASMLDALRTATETAMDALTSSGAAHVHMTCLREQGYDTWFHQLSYLDDTHLELLARMASTRMSPPEAVGVFSRRFAHLPTAALRGVELAYQVALAAVQRTSLPPAVAALVMPSSALGRDAEECGCSCCNTGVSASDYATLLSECPTAQHVQAVREALAAAASPLVSDVAAAAASELALALVHPEAASETLASMSVVLSGGAPAEVVQTVSNTTASIQSRLLRALASSNSAPRAGSMTPVDALALVDVLVGDLEAFDASLGRVAAIADTAREARALLAPLVRTMGESTMASIRDLSVLERDTVAGRELDAPQLAAIRVPGVALPALGARRLDALIALLGDITSGMSAVPGEMQTQAAKARLMSRSFPQHQEWLRTFTSMVQEARFVTLSADADWLMRAHTSLRDIEGSITTRVSSVGAVNAGNAAKWFGFASTGLLDGFAAMRAGLARQCVSSTTPFLLSAHLEWVESSARAVAQTYDLYLSTVDVCSVGCPTEVEQVQMHALGTATASLRARLRMVVSHVINETQRTGRVVTEEQPLSEPMFAAVSALHEAAQGFAEAWAFVTQDTLNILTALGVEPALSQAVAELLDACSTVLMSTPIASSVGHLVSRVHLPILRLAASSNSTTLFDGSLACGQSGDDAGRIAHAVRAVSASWVSGLASLSSGSATAEQLQALVASGFGSDSPLSTLLAVSSTAHSTVTAAVSANDDAGLAASAEVRAHAQAALSWRLCGDAAHATELNSSLAAPIATFGLVADDGAAFNTTDAAQRCSSDFFPEFAGVLSTPAEATASVLSAHGSAAVLDIDRLSAELPTQIVALPQDVGNATLCSATHIRNFECTTDSYTGPAALSLLSLVATEVQLGLPDDFLAALPPTGEPGFEAQLLEGEVGSVAASDFQRLSLLLSLSMYATDNLLTADADLASTLAGIPALHAALNDLDLPTPTTSVLPVLAAHSNLCDFYASLASLEDIMSDLTPFLASPDSLMMMDPQDFDALLERMMAVATQVQSMSDWASIPLHLIVATLRVEIANVIDTIISLPFDDLVTLTDVDTELVPLVRKGALESMTEAGRYRLLRTLDTALVVATTHSTPSLVALLATLRTSVSSTALAGPVNRLVGALETTKDAQAVSAASLLFGSVATYTDDGPVFPEGQQLLGRLQAQLSAVVSTLATNNGAGGFELLEVAVAGADAVHSVMTHGTIPVFSYASFTGGSPWSKQRLARLRAALREVSTLLPQLTEQSVAEVGEEVNGASVQRALRTLAPKAMRLLVLVKTAVAAVDALEETDPGLLSSTATAAVNTLVRNFRVRCVTSCAYDIRLSRGLLAAASANDLYVTFRSLSLSSSLEEILGEGRAEVAESLQVLVDNGYDSLAPHSMPQPLPSSSEGADMVKKATLDFTNSLPLLTIPELAAQPVGALLTDLQELSDTLEAMALEKTFRTMRELASLVSDIRVNMEEAARNDFDIASFMDHSDATLAAAATVLARYLPIVEAWVFATVSSDGIALASSTVTSMDMLAEYVDTVDRLSGLLLRDFGVVGMDTAKELLASLMPWLGDLTLAELNKVNGAALLEATSIVNSVAALAPEPSDPIVSYALAKLFEAAETVHAIMVDVPHRVRLPMVKSTDYNYNTARFYNELLVEGSTLRKSAVTLLTAARFSTSPVDVKLVKAAEIVVGALDTVAEERFDVGSRLMADAGLEMVELMGHIADVSALLQGGADFMTVRRLASTAAAELQKRLQAAVMKQVKQIVSTFNGFVSNTVNDFGGDGTPVIEQEEVVVTREETYVAVVVNPEFASMIDQGVPVDELDFMSPTIEVNLTRKVKFVQIVEIVHNTTAMVSEGNANPLASSKAFGKLTGFFDQAKTFVGKGLVLVQTGVDKVKGGVDLVKRFKDAIVGKIKEKLAIVDRTMATVDRVFNQFIGVLDIIVEFRDSTETVERLASKYVALAVSKLDSKLGILVDTFDSFVSHLDTMEEVVMQKVEDVKEWAVKAANDTMTAVRQMAGDVLPMVQEKAAWLSDVLDSVDQKLEVWQDIANIALDIARSLSEMGGDDDLGLGKLAQVLESVLRGVTFVRTKLAQVVDVLGKVDDVFNNVLDFGDLISPFLDKIPAKEYVTKVFDFARSALASIRSEGLRLKDQLLSSLTSFVNKGIAKVLAVLQQHVSPIAGAVEWVRDSLLTAKGAVDSVFNLVDRREWLFEKLDLLTSFLDAPIAAIESTLLFAHKFLGIEDPRTVDSEARRRLFAIGGCEINFEFGPAVDAAKDVAAATTALVKMIPSLLKLGTIGKELFSLATVSGRQKCVEGSSCGLTMIAARLGEVADMLGTLEGGIASVQRFGTSLPYIAGGVGDIGRCLEVVPDTIDRVVGFVDSFMTGAMFNNSNAEDPTIEGLLSKAENFGGAAGKLAKRFRDVLDTVQFHVDSIATPVNNVLNYAGDVINVLQIGSSWAAKAETVLVDVDATRELMNDYLDVLDIGALLQKGIDWVMDKADKFLSTLVVRTPSAYKKIHAQAVKLVELMRSGHNFVNEKKQLLTVLVEKINKFMGLGKVDKDMVPFEELPYCSDDEKDNGVCLRQEKRSHFLYRNVVFPAMYTQFWYNTIPSFRTPKRMNRAVIPGLFESYIPRGVSAIRTDTTSYLLSMQPTGPNSGRPSILVRMQMAQQGGVLRIFQLYDTDGKPFTGSVSDVAITGYDGHSDNMPFYVWTCDDTQDEDLYSNNIDNRNNRIVAAPLSTFLLDAEREGAPLAVSLTQSYYVDAKPAGLWYERGETDGLWIVEYAEPLALAADGTISEKEPASWPFAAKTTNDDVQSDFDGASSSATDTKVAATSEATDQEQKAAGTDQSAEKDDEELPVVMVTTNPDHCEAGQCGWAIRLALAPETGLPNGITATDIDGLNPIVVQDLAFFVGEGVRGFALGKQLGATYAFLLRCSMASGYPCRIEYHQYELPGEAGDDDNTDSQHSLATGNSVSSYLVGTALVKVIGLDTGIPPEMTDEVENDIRTTATEPFTTKATEAGAIDQAITKAATKAVGDATVENTKMGWSDTMTSKWRVPYGAVGMEYFSDTSNNFMMFTFASAAQPYFVHTVETGNDAEDSTHRVAIPGLATLPPDIHQNVAYVKFTLFYKVAPRCLLPIGEECWNDHEAKRDAESTEGSQVKPERKSRFSYGRRRLMVVDPNAQNEDVGAIPMTRRAQHLMASALGREADSGEMSRSWCERNMAAAAGVELQRHEHGRSLVTRGAKYADTSRCLTADIVLVPPTPIILYKQTFLLFAWMVPFNVAVQVALLWNIDLSITVCIADKTLITSLIPGVALEVEIFGGWDIPYVARLGIVIALTLLDIKFIPSASLSVKSGLDVCLSFDIALIPIKIAMYVVVGLFLCPKFCEVCGKVFGKKVCVPLPCGIIYCLPGFKFKIWSWSFPELRMNIFTICSAPPDRTPPDTTDAFVSAKQTTVESIYAEWGGFFDEESNVKGYVACVGKAPGFQDVAKCMDLGLDQSKTFDRLGLEGLDGVKVYVSVFARNGEGLMSTVVDALVLDDSGPEVTLFEVQQYYDGSFTDKWLMKHGEPSSLTIRAFIEEPNPEETTVVETVEVAVGTGPFIYDNVAAWHELLFDFNAPDAEPVVHTISELALQHRVAYWIHIRTTNTVGRQSIVTAPTVVYCDLTPSTGETAIHNGASILLEEHLAWMPLSDPHPEFSSVFWKVAPSWEFSDEESEMVRYDAYLHDAHGDPDNPIAVITNINKRANTITFEDLDLPHGLKFYAEIRGQTDADHWTEVETQRTTIDRTRPHTVQVLDLAGVPTTGPLSRNATTEQEAAGVVEPGTLTPAELAEVEIDFVQNLDKLFAGFSVWDEDSGIKTVMVAVGVAPGSTSLMPWTSIPANGGRVVPVSLPTGVDFVRHVRYYVSVAAVNVRVVLRTGFVGKVCVPVFGVGCV